MVADIDTAADPSVVMRDGVPWVKYDGAPEKNAVTVIQWGLERHAKGDNAAAIRAAEWLVDNQCVDGTWRYGFDYYVESADTTLPAGWVSALAQGQALSLLVRAWEITGDSGYLDAGRAALGAFSRPVEEGGVLRFWRGHPFYEEYPTVGPSLVLNGFLFALVGLHEFAEATADAEAERLWVAGEETAATLLPLYAYGDTTTYGLAHLASSPVAPEPVGGVYPLVVHNLVDEMYALTGRAVYGDAEARLAGRLAPSDMEVYGPLVAALVVLLLLLAGIVLRIRRGRSVNSGALPHADNLHHRVAVGPAASPL